MDYKPASNMTWGGAIGILYATILYLADANHWLVVTAPVYSSVAAVTWLASYYHDLKNGNNKS